MTDDLAVRIGKLEAAEAIRQLRAENAYACDEGFPAERIAALYLEDGVFDAGEYGRHQGREAIAAYFEPVPKSLSWCIHVVGTETITVADNLTEATGRWYFFEPCTMNGEAHWITGSYLDRYGVDADGRWRFAEVTLVPGIVAPYASGWAA
jgi:uncharacterized protein (TIGR02246 family)